MIKTIATLIVSLLLVSFNVSAQKNKKTIKKTKTQPSTATETKTKSDNPAPLAVSKSESEILAELNTLRTNPKSYIPYLEEMKKSFSGKNFKNAQGEDIITFEGVAAVNEAIDVLKNQTPVSDFKLSAGLTKAAGLHLQDMIKNDFFGHRGSDQSMPDERVGQFGRATAGIAQNLTEGSRNPREIVLQMLVSDGLKSRSQRNNLFNSQFRFVGISAGEAKRGYLCVLVLAGAFEEKR